jgi:lysozyme
MIDYDRAALRRELSRDEDRRNKPYFDSKGIKTVGVGWNLEANGIPHEVLPLLGLTSDSHDLLAPFSIDYEWPEPAIDALLDIGILRAERGLDVLLPHWRDMDAARQRVCLNLCFNMGANRLAGFHDMLAAVRLGDWAAAAAEMKDSAWFKQVGVRAPRLVAMMATGQDVGNVA